MTRLTKPVARVTNSRLSAQYGPDSDRPVVVRLIPGEGTRERPDMLELRPLGTRRPELLDVRDAYRIALQGRANREHLSKAREAKERKAARLAAQRQQRFERRMVLQARRETAAALNKATEGESKVDSRFLVVDEPPFTKD